MKYNRSMLKLAGVWRYLLVVESDTPQDYTGVTEVTDVQQTESGSIETHYLTEGLYRTIEQDGRYFYWFLYNSSYVTLSGESAELAELREANDILMGVSE